VYKSQDISGDNIILGDIDIDGNGTIEALVNPDNFAGTYGNTIASKGISGGFSTYADLGLFLTQTTGYVYIQIGDTATLPSIRFNFSCINRNMAIYSWKSRWF